MGLDYSIRTYVRKDKLPQSLNWLYANSEGTDSPIKIGFGDDILAINGSSLKVNNNQGWDKKYVITNFKTIDFSTSLAFDIDPQIIESIAGWDFEYRTNAVEEFKTEFEGSYLGNGKMVVRGFDSTITQLKTHDVYEIDLRAVTTDISVMLEKSISVKKWIREFSKMSEAVITYLDLEHNGRRILYYNGQEIELTIKEGFDQDSFNLVRNLLKDYHELECDVNTSA